MTDDSKKGRYGDHERNMRTFLRDLDPEERLEYKRCRGNTAKEKIRANLATKRQRVTEASGTVTVATQDKKIDKKTVWYMNFPNLVKSFGGEISLEWGTRSANNWLEACKKKRLSIRGLEWLDIGD